MHRKLDDEDVRDVFALALQGFPQHKIAKWMGVTQSSINHILLGKTYSKLDRRNVGIMFDEETDCWIWTGKLSNGYGYINRNKQCIPAHRYYWEELMGPIPDGMHLDHLCRRPACVNPNHLEPVTNQVNSQRGARAKVTPEKACEIFKAYRGDCMATYSYVGRRFNVSPEIVRNIVQRVTWGNVNPPPA